MKNFMKDGKKQGMAFLHELKNLRSSLARLEELRMERRRSTRQCIQADRDWKEIFDTVTDMITVHDRDFNIIDANKAARETFGLPSLLSAGVKCFRYYHGTERPPEGCPSCTCMTTGVPASCESYEPHLKMHIEIRSIPRFGSNGRLTGLIHIVRDITRRKMIEEELRVHRDHLEWLVKERTTAMTEANERLRHEIVERIQAEEDRERLIRELQEALDNIKTLRGLLPMCAWCKRIRDEGGAWKSVEVYINEHTDASFTHGICPECAKSFDKDLRDLLREKDDA